ncbi:MAG: HAD family hydrolase [Clostridiales bacterium]|nr:HAD family hydrolase [Clostridiales bacterium]
MQYKLIIFDLDDTLFDYNRTEQVAVEFACNQQGIPYSSNTYMKYKTANLTAKTRIKSYLRNLTKFRKMRVEVFFELLSFTNGDASKFVDDYLEYSKIGIMIDGVEETIPCLNVKKVVATNGSDIPRYNKFINSTIAPYFSAFYSSERLGSIKPDVMFYKKILSEMGTSPSDALVVGNNFETDILSALNCGLDVCWFNWKMEAVPEQYSKIKVIYQFQDLQNIIG